MFMAIVGIAGCAGLMVAGVGLKDSLSSVSDKQFGPITNYQAIVTLDGETENSETKAKEQLESDPKITDLLAVNMQTIELRQQGQATQSITMIIPETSKGLSPFIHLISLKGRNMELNDSGIVLTQKAAELFDVSEGDRLSLYTDDQKSYRLR